MDSNKWQAGLRPAALSGGGSEETDRRVGLLLSAFGQVADFGTTLLGFFQWWTGVCRPRVKVRTDHSVWKSLVGNKEMHGG